MNGTLPSQRVVQAPLGELVERVREAGLGAPSVVVVGEVVSLRESLAWFERQPLFGRRVLVTRPREQAGEMLAALRAAGAEAVVIPMIRIAPPGDYADADAALDRLDRYDALLVTSANAIRALALRASERGTPLTGFAGRVVCVGPRTAGAARAMGLRADVVPTERFDAEGMLAAIQARLAPAGKRYLMPCAAEARDTLVRGLRAAGARVDAVTVYRTVAAEVDAAALRERLVAGDFDALTFTSPSTVRHFVAHLDAPARAAAGRCVVAAIGPVTAEALRKEGLAPQLVPERAGAPELVAALAEHLPGPGGPR